MDKLGLPKGLRGRILVSIKHEEIRRARIYVLVALSTTIFSLLGVVFAFKYMIQGFYQTSFYSYFSLLFSDPDIALSYWKELSLSLVEALPLLGITLSLVAVAILLTSLRVFVRKVKSNLIPSFSN
jgi:hypothetical protein